MPQPKNEKVPTNSAIIDMLVNIAAVIHPLTTLPQIYAIYSSQSVAGISLWTWLGFMLIGFIFLAYGLVHHLKPIILTQVLWFIVDATVIIGVLLYQ
jgi:uncharacterized protein with PQ loop repeat